MGNFTDWLVSAVSFLACAIGIITFLNSVIPLLVLAVPYVGRLVR